MLECPAEWYAEFSLQQRVAEVLRCTVPQVEEVPLAYKLKAAAYIQVQDQTRNAREQRIQQRIEHESKTAGNRRR